MKMKMKMMKTTLMKMMNNGFVVESVYTTDLKSVGVSHAGSSPAKATII